jgi:hypothetical protein
MQHNISITVINDSTGVAPQSNGVMGIFARAIAVSTTFVLNTPYLLTELADAVALGITAAYDTANSVAVYQQVSEFYAQAGTGALLWLIGVPDNTAFATYVASATFNQMIQATAVADPANRVKMIGLCYDVPILLQHAADFPSDVTGTLTALQTAQNTLFNQGYQFSAIVDGYNMSSTVTPATIGTQATNSAYSCSLCITGTKPNGVSAVGLALGRFARISIGHGFGAVADGAVNTATAYLTNAIKLGTTGVLVVGDVMTVQGTGTATVTYNSATYAIGDTFTVVTGHTTFTATGDGYVVGNMAASIVANLSPTYVDQLGAKQFMFLRTWMNHSGFYWNDGATCESSTLQLSTQEYNRVANALSADALEFFINQMGQNLPLQADGAVAQGYLNVKQEEFYNTYINPLTVAGGSGDITDAAMVLSAPNFNSTKTMYFALTIQPTPILGNVVGTIRFSSTL